jgi:NitT/TauT family transport system substrate-binding protein
MCSPQTIALRCHRAVLAALTAVLVTALLGLAPVTAGPSEPAGRPQVAVQLSFEHPLNASMAPFVLATSRGLFASEGLSVTTEIVGGSAAAIARVASGASEFALVDLNELIRFRDKPDAPPIKAFFVLFNKAP